MNQPILKNLKRLFSLVVIASLLSGKAAAGTINVESNITSDTTWSSSNTYVLTDIIYVTGDATLTIEAGTTIKGEPKSAGAFDPGTLVITQGSKIEAVGTAEAPIIFTSTEDDGSLTEADSGLWGGVILLGKATINRPAGTEYIEGLPTSDLGIYGGTDDADNSGTLKYVSIRHGGAAIASDNEINGLTMGGVGSATTIEYVEVFANADDGFEWFGGTVNSKYLVGAFNNDDTFDWDEGFTGKGQFWFAIQAEGADRGAEMDGGPSSAPDAQPYSTPVIYNATFIGAGADGGSQVMKFRENTGGIYANSIFTGFEKGVDVDTGGKDGATIASGQDSEARFTAGDLALKANIYHDIAGASDIAGIVAIGDSDGANADFKSNFTSALTSAGSTFEDPQLAGISRVEGAALDPRPATDGPAYSGLTSLPADDVFYSSVSHKGAFGTADWTGSWSKTGASYTGDIFTPTAGTVYVESNITADTIWSSFNTYVLTDIIYVTGDATLTIEAGTTIKGEPKSAGAFDPGTLVITQGSKIEAVGTAEAPIIFTSTEDDGSLTEADSGLWGGVILLGKATINRPAGTEYIEGLPTSDLGIYGGTDDADNSGTLKYVSIRHGGAAIASDNEINGLTMGGVGSATTIEYVEVFANADDGFEWFGGTVNSKYLVGAFNNDDTFDWDEGFTGKGQFWFAIQAEGADRGAEMDGGPSSAPDAQPYSTPVIYNATFIGAGADGGSQVMKFRENTGGIYANSIFTGFEKGVDVDTGGKDGATIASGQDSEARFTAGDLALKANIYHDIAGASDIAGIVAIGDSDGANADFKSNFTSALTSAGSTFEDPQLAGISRVEGAALDPRPATDGPAYSGLTSLPADDVFYSSVSHKGAFGTADWTGSWSKIGASYTGSIPSLQILGKKSITLIVGETYSEKGAFARDHEGRSLSYYINKTGTVDTSTGRYI